MDYSSVNNEPGFSVLEMLIAVAVSMLLLIAAVKMLVTQMEAFNEEAELSDMQQNMRVAMGIIAREAKMAGYDPTGGVFALPPYGITSDGINFATDTLRIQADLNGDGDTDDTHEDITYSYDSANREIDRDTGGGGQTVAENIEGLIFENLDENFATTTTSADIRQVWIEITGRTSNIDTRTGDFRYGTLTTTINPRNLTYDEDD